MEEAFIYDGIRTPFGRFGGVLARFRADDLMAVTISEIVKRNPQITESVDDVVIGDSIQSGEDSRNVARNASLLSGLPVTVSGITVNRLCGSGLAAVSLAANSIKCGEGNLFIAGGVENMTRAPFVMGKSESAYARTAPIYDSTMGWRFPNEKLIDKFGSHTMPETAENIAEKLGISREDSDVFAYESQVKYESARKRGYYDGEIMPLEIPAIKAKQAPVIVSTDEHPRPDSNLEALTGLKSLHKNGIVTAGNASGINDGAAALLVGNESLGKNLGLKPMAKIIASAVAGVEPSLMGLGLVPASLKALERAGLALADMDLIEINEAFAVQVLGCLKELGLPFNDTRVNPNGGAIAIGHPLGASGARLILTAARELQQRNGKYALVTLCIGIGQGIAVIIENVRK